MKYWIGGLMAIIGVELGAQTVSGTVYDQMSNTPLPGATISVSGTLTGVAADENGFYELTDLEPGHYRLLVSYVGYTGKTLSEVWVKTGVVTRLDVYLERNSSSLDEVIVTTNISITEPGKIGITEEQINRFAATYYDPARLVTSSPDVAVTNDQNNQISVRGISPNYNTWRLEGAEIVNPNHLSNAGTFLDQPSATGGGVNMLSAQMLSQSQFLYSTFDSRYSNSVGGVFDMNLKNGNTTQRQYTAQASLIGLDLATEGPFREGGKMTYAANYRYSFTGLLTQFGVDFGGESIGFQDLSLNVSTPLGTRSRLKVFGTGGLSFNNFDHKPMAESEVIKDRRDIYYDNKTGVIGASLKSGFDNSHLTTSVVLSGYENTRDQYGYDDNDVQDTSLIQHNSQRILSMHSSYERSVGGANVTLGVLANQYHWTGSLQGIFDHSLNQFLINPYAQVEWYIFSDLKVKAGVNYNQSADDSSIDPRISLTQQLNANNSFILAGGKYSQLTNPYNSDFVSFYGGQRWGEIYELLKSYRGTLTHVYEKRGFNVQSEFFGYYYPSVIALGERTAWTFGGTLTSEKSFSDGLYFRLGGSLFESEIEGFVIQPYNTRYNMSMAAGKEWDVSKGTKNRRLGLNLRGQYQGGFYYSENIPTTDGSMSGYSRFDYRTAPYLRFDVRLLWTRYRENRTTSIALDLQNASGVQNEGYKYFDGFTNQLETQYQLGLIPILTYRVEW
ncbi:TonB-dependent receptor [Marinoscillum sp. 108]|uniref:TonB-dependent receptor n=1 Tax=Marinoscillum sp. 108 TaxID=2653151 RepID=UPI0012EF0EAC|nr:TonB-dependent receptor [Marinoscillum sp. 108]VXD21482.1 TonB-dependent receptor-like protein [Marinoscillum sp. 108]